MKLQRPDPGIDVAKSGLHGKAGLFFDAGVFEKGEPSFGIQDLDPYLLFDARESMLGTLENPTLDLDPATPSTLDVITATRSGTATYTDPDGNIATAAADTVRVDYTQGEELTPTVFQHIKFTDFSGLWSLYTYGGGSLTKTSGYASPEGNNDAHKFDIVIGTGGALFTHNATILNSQDYTLSVWLKGEVGGEKVRVDLKNTSSSGVSGSLFTLTNEWQRYEVTVTADATNRGFQFRFTASNGVSDQTIYVYGPQLEEGTTASDFVANTTGSPKFLSSAVYSDRVPMILVEPSSENLWGWSEGTLNDYQTNAVLVGETYLSDDATSRNGLNSWLYFQPSSDTQVGFRMPVSVTSGSTMILSFYVIMDDGSKPRVGTSSTGSDTDFAILLQGISSAGVAGGVEHISGDLYRVWAYRVFTGTSNAQYIYRYATHSGKGFKISGVMLEESSVPTSYIPTSGSTVTRQADDLVISGSDFDFYNQSEGTIYFEGNSNGITDPRLFEFSDGTTSNRTKIDINDGSNFRTSVVNNGSVIVSEEVSFTDAESLFRAALSFKVNDLEGNLNGVSVINETPASLPTLDQLHVGSNHDGGANYLNGHIKRLIYWPYHSDSL